MWIQWSILQDYHILYIHTTYILRTEWVITLSDRLNKNWERPLYEIREFIFKYDFISFIHEYESRHQYPIRENKTTILFVFFIFMHNFFKNHAVSPPPFFFFFFFWCAALESINHWWQNLHLQDYVAIIDS